MIQRRNFGSTGMGAPRRSRGSSSRLTGVASVRYLPSGLFIQVEAPYNKPFTDELKKSVPAKKRMWYNNDKCWYVVKDQFDKLTHLMDKHYDETILLDFPEQEVSNDSWSKLWLIEGAPLEIVQAVYKVLSKKHHPDLGGDVVKMTEINVAHKDILGEFAEKENGHA